MLRQTPVGTTLAHGSSQTMRPMRCMDGADGAGPKQRTMTTAVTAKGGHKYATLSVTRPHSEAFQEWEQITTWMFSCAKCGEQQRLARYTPTDKHGNHLYCWRCAFPELGRPLMEFGFVFWQYWWCKRGQHVITGGPCRQQQKPEPDRTRSCDHCGETFAPTRSDAKFCSGRCRVAAHREKK
jgi:hypothetical protein